MTVDTTYRCPIHGDIKPIWVHYNAWCPECKAKRESEHPPRIKVKWVEIRPGVFERADRMTDGSK